MSNKASDKNVANIEGIMSQEAFNELIDNLEVVATLTMYGRKSIKHYVKEMQAELERKDKRIQELEEECKRKDMFLQMSQEVIENSIPTQRVENKIEELKEVRKIALERKMMSSVESFEIAIGHLQELLEGRNENG